MKTRRAQISIVVVVGLLLIGLAVLPGCEKKEPAPVPEPNEVTAAADAAAAVQTTCPIMGKSIDKAVFTEYQGQKVYFCCPA